jgi:hypothetical protein
MISKQSLIAYGEREALPYAELVSHEYASGLSNGFTTAIELLWPFVDAIKFIEKNCELISYEPVGGDGAPSGYLPYPCDSEFVRQALSDLEKRIGAE